MEFRKMVTITLYTRQQKRHWCIEQSFGLCGRGRGWDDLGQWHWNMYNIIYEMSRQSRFDAQYWMLGAGALGWPSGMVWGGRKEEGSGWGTHVYLWRIHFNIWQNQYNIVKFKNKIKKKVETTTKIKWSGVTQSCLTLQPHGLYPTWFLCPWDFPGKNTGVGCHSLLQEIFLTQGLNSGLPHCRQTLYHLSHQWN